LKDDWAVDLPAGKKLAAMACHVSALPQPEEIEAAISIVDFPALHLAVNEDFIGYGTESDGCCF